MDTYFGSDLLEVNKRSLMRYRILTYTINELGRKDFSGISVSRLCNDLGISRTSFYDNFSCRRDLFSQVLRNFWHETVAHNEGLSYRDSIEYMINRIGSRKTAVQNLMKKNFTELDSAAVAKFLAQTALREFEVHKTMGRKMGFDIELAAAYCGGGFLHIISYWIENDFKYTSDQVVDCIMKICEGEANLFDLPDYRQKSKEHTYVVDQVRGLKNCLAGSMRATR